MDAKERGELFLLIFCACWAVVKPDLTFCPDLCECNGFTINCAARGLDEIPKNLPSEVQRL